MCLSFVALMGKRLFCELSAQLRQSRCCIRELLRVVVAGQCKSGVVEAEIKLGQLVLQHKLTQRLLLGKLVTKTQSVVEQAETHIELTCGRDLLLYA